MHGGLSVQIPPDMSFVLWPFLAPCTYHASSHGTNKLLTYGLRARSRAFTGQTLGVFGRVLYHANIAIPAASRPTELGHNVNLGGGGWGLCWGTKTKENRK